MKVLLQAVIGSIAIHIIFLVGMMVVGYIETRNYKPNIADTWDDTVVILQDEVVFGEIISPDFGLLSIMGVAFILGFIRLLYKEMTNKNNGTI